MAKLRKPDAWKRCWRGKVPWARRVLIFDSNERVALVDSRVPKFFEAWELKTGGKIKFYIIVPEVPYETLPLWPELEEVA
jgi:hypothetical protein